MDEYLIKTPVPSLLLGTGFLQTLYFISKLNFKYKDRKVINLNLA